MLKKYGLNIPAADNRALVTSAYADDITVFLTKE
jgi:hypothetical protein